MCALPPAFRACLLSIACILLPITATAESVTNRFVCVLGDYKRVVELAYLAEPNSVPCEIREAKYNGQQQILWRANFDVSFCQRQLEDYRAKLQLLGWPCETTDIENSQVHSKKQPVISEVAFIPSANTLALTDQRAQKTARQEISGQVYLHENELSESPTAKYRPDLPNSTISQLSIEELRQLDDWLIYLSAQSMLSIERLMPESGKFRNYQLQEGLHSGDIYLRLQNRIEFLHSLLVDR